jgi:hypothetical protein
MVSGDIGNDEIPLAEFLLTKGYVINGSKNHYVIYLTKRMDPH